MRPNIGPAAARPAGAAATALSSLLYFIDTAASAVNADTIRQIILRKWGVT